MVQTIEAQHDEDGKHKQDHEHEHEFAKQTYLILNKKICKDRDDNCRDQEDTQAIHLPWGTDEEQGESWWW